MLLFPAPFGFRLAIGPRNLPPSSSRLNRGYNRALSWRSKVVQIIKPAIRIIAGPTVQLGLDLSYPTLGCEQPRHRIIGIHRRPPSIPLSLPLDLLAPLALQPAFPASMTGRYARDYYGASAPLVAIS
jgi:hypothetical protein